MATITRKIVPLLFLFIATTAIAGEKNSSPVTFIENKGQWQKEILFQGTSLSPNVYFMNDGLSFGISGKEIENEEGEEEYPYEVWNMKFVNPNTQLSIQGMNGKESVISYLSGSDPTKWIIHPKEFSEIKYASVFEKVDLHFYGEGNNLKYDYILHNGGNINSIKAYYAGVKKIQVTANGELEVITDLQKQIQKSPVAWQEINGEKKRVEISYIILNDSTFGFYAPGGYNPDFDLVIDPLFTMVWSTYTKATGTSNNLNYCFSNAMDKEGNVYITGMVDGTFPVTPGAYSGAGTVFPDIIVAKFSSDGTTLIYSTYLPANSSEHGVAIAVDDSGRAYITGVIDLNITGVTNYPSTPNAFQPIHDQGSDAFLTVLNPDGTGLVYSSFLGGSGGETGYDVVLGPMGIAYVAGVTSTGSFPTKATNVFPTGDQDLFVSKFDINQSGNNSLIYSTRIGAGAFSNCKAKSIDVNSAGNIFITGTIGTSFGVPAFPTTPGAYQTTYSTGQDNIMSFVTKLSANTPVSLDYSTLLAPGTANCISVHDASGDAFISGSTYTFAFPVTAGVLQPVHGGTYGTDGFVVRMNAVGTALVYSTFLGGEAYESSSGIVVNSAGEAYVTGIAQDSFPVSAGAIQTANAGSEDFFAVHLNSTGTAYGCGGSTFIGGSDEDYSGSFYDYSSPYISIRDHGGVNDTICISSTSHSQDFPTTPGVYGPIKVNSIADQPVFFKLTCDNGNTALPVAQFSSPDSICPGTCVDFTNLSQNASSFQWSFPGATITSSTDTNPSGICYPNPGNYDVMLIASGVSGSDTITITNYITVYPFPTPQGILQSGDTLFANPGNTTYQWYFNGNIIIGATDYFYVATQSGNYNVVATDENDCEVEAVINNVIAAVGSSSKQSIHLYPNPVKDIITIQKSGVIRGAASEISIYNLMGDKIMSTISNETQIRLDVSYLTSGMYFLEVVTDGKTFREKFTRSSDF